MFFSCCSVQMSLVLLLVLGGHGKSIDTSARFTLRSARSTDLVDIFTLVQSELVPAPSLNWWQDCLQDGRFCFVACQEGIVVGVVATRLFPLNDEFPARGHISVCVVAPSVQGKGCGSMLLKQAERAILRKGLGECITLYVRCSNERAIRFYCGRHGFSLHRRVRGYYFPVGEQPAEDAMLLVRWAQVTRGPVSLSTSSSR